MVRPKTSVWRQVRRLLARDVTSDRRGVALLISLSAIAVMAAFSVEFSYNMRVNVHQATNLKREVQAYYHARSAMEIARAVIFAEKRFKTLLGPLGGQANLELWRYACKFAEIFHSGNVNFLGTTLFSLKDYDGIGVKDGEFSCEIVPEDGRINVGRVGNLQDNPASAAYRLVVSPPAGSLVDLRPTDDGGAAWTAYAPDKDLYSRTALALATPSLAPWIDRSETRIEPAAVNATFRHRPLRIVLRKPEA